MPDSFELTLGRQVARAGREFAASDAVVDGRRRVTFAELEEMVVDCAGAFVAAGIEPGETVAIWAPNSLEWIVAALGASTAGAVIVPLNTRYRGREATDILARSRSRLLVAANGFLGLDYVAMLGEGRDELPHLRQIVRVGQPGGDGTRWGDFLATSSSAGRAEARRRRDQQSPRELCDVIFTSGTTGRPKGVMSEHEQNMRVYDAWASTIGLRRGDRYLVVNPFFHCFGFKAGIIAGLLQGATIFPEPIFDVDAVLRRVEQERITVLPGPPTIYLSILNHPGRDRFDLSSLRLAVTGAADVPAEMLRRMGDELSFSTVLTAYGQTEATGTISVCRTEDPLDVVATTSGRAIPGVELQVVDDDGRRLPPGTAGEILCRGYVVMRGYLDDPSATDLAIDADGWLHTGDIGTVDKQGYVSITDRKKDMFITGGYNVYPAEVEGLLLHHPAIAQVAVIGVPDERLGEVGHAFVIPRHGVDVTPDEIVAWARSQIAGFKVPRHLTIVEALPLTASGKVMKGELRVGAARHGVS